jgi:hypothetical protein
MQYLPTKTPGKYWVVQPIREVLPRLDLTSVEGISHAKNVTLCHHFELGGKTHISFANEDRFAATAGQDATYADFGRTLASHYVNEQPEKESPAVIYVENVGSGCLIVAVHAGEVVFDAILSIDKDDSQNVIKKPIEDKVLQLTSGLKEYPIKILVHSTDSDLLSGVSERNLRYFPVERMTMLLQPNSDFVSISELRSRKSGKKNKRQLLVGAAVAGVLALTLALWLNKDKEEPVVTDPFLTFRNYRDTEAFNVLNRLNQVYNTTVQLQALTGWTLTKVNLARQANTYIVDATEQGDIATLNRFADAYKLAIKPVLSKSSQFELLQQPANIPSTSDKRAFSVTEVHQFITDAVSLYIPGGEVELVRDTPQGAWLQRELVVKLKGHHSLYINTIGAIVEQLPVSFGTNDTDPAIGSLGYENESFDGNIKLTIYGVE